MQPVPLIIGIVLCLFGWKLYRGGLLLVGGTIGVMAGWVISLVLQGLLEVEPGQELGATLGGLGVGFLAGLLLARVAQRWMFFFLGAALGGVAAHFAGPGAERFEILAPLAEWQTVLRFVLPPVFGMLFVFFSRSMTILITSAVGALLLVHAVPGQAMLYLAAPIFLFAVGFQYELFRRSQKAKIRDALREAEEAKR